MTRFEEYVERFSKQHGLTSKEAVKHKMVQEVKACYIEEELLQNGPNESKGERLLTDTNMKGETL